MKYVYQVRLGDDNEELRYSLRSLEKNAPEGEVVIGGYLPSWIDPDTVTHVNIGQAPHGAFKDRNAMLILEGLVKSLDHDDEWVMMNDDFFFLKPVDEIKTYHGGTLEEAARRSREVHTMKILGESEPVDLPGIGYEAVLFTYADSLDSASEFLKKDGVREPLMYDLHVPLRVNPALLDKALRWADLRYPPYRAGGGTFHRWNVRWRSIYGNLFVTESTYRKDVKIYEEDAVIPRGSDLISTSDNLFKEETKVYRSLKSRFRTPSRFEKG